jgi:hypothetical protein
MRGHDCVEKRALEMSAVDKSGKWSSNVERTRGKQRPRSPKGTYNGVLAFRFTRLVNGVRGKVCELVELESFVAGLVCIRGSEHNDAAIVSMVALLWSRLDKAIRRVERSELRNDGAYLSEPTLTRILPGFYQDSTRMLELLHGI